MKRILQIGKYISVAVLSAGSDWVVFTVLISVFNLEHLAALVVARVVGGVVSFLSNRYWTWGRNHHITLTKQGLRFIILYAVSYAISISEFYLLNSIFGLSAYAAKLVTDCTCFVVNYLVMNGFVFRAKPRSGASAAPTKGYDLNASLNSQPDA